MNCFTRFCTAVAMVIASRSVFAQTYESTGTDILPTIVNGVFYTGGHYDPSGLETPNIRVYDYSFQSNPDDPYFDQDPGINAQVNSGLIPGSTISFNVLSSLSYWNGVGPVTQTAPPAGEQIQYNFAIYNTYVSGTSGVQTGFTIAAVASNETFHRHLNAFLLASDGNADASDGVVATPGIYMLTFQVVDQGVASSQPLYMVYDNGLDVSVLDEARTYLRNAYAPLTNLTGLSDYPSDPGNFPSSWNVDANGNWTNSSNWDLAVPSTAVDSANFGQTITAPRTVTLDAPQTVGHLAFDNSNAYTLAGAQLTIGDGTTIADVVVNSGSHTIASPLYLASPTTFTIDLATSTLDVTLPITSAGGVLVAKEGLGSFVVPQINSSGLNIVQGTVQLSPHNPAVPAASLSTLGALSVQSGATLDLTNNAIIINYTGASPIASITASIAAAYDGGKWDHSGITSSSAAMDPSTAVGVADNATLQLSTFEGTYVNNSAVLVRYTWLGDANLDGVVNGSDLTLLLAGESYGLAGWQNGDFNYNGVVNADDFALFMLGDASQNGDPAGEVPEPAGLSIGVLFLLILTIFRRPGTFFDRRATSTIL